MHKLQVSIRNDVENPFDRKYTLTHSDETGMRFLFIDKKYAEDQYCCHRDEVVADWNLVNDRYVFKVSCPLECEVSKYSADERLQIFRRHMERVLLAVLGGDKEFILKNSKLLDAKNHIYYYYRNERYIFEEMGRVRDYIKESAE